MTQMELIKSLGEAMTWFEREMDWGVPPTELRHLCGRIGELYVAVITNGRMATEINQKGYDVLGADLKRISVKTTAKMGFDGHISFNANTLEFVDQVVVLRINTDEMQIETLLDVAVTDAVSLMTPSVDGRRTLALSKLGKKSTMRASIKSKKEVIYQDVAIRELENGSIEVERDGELMLPAKPMLRDIAARLNISHLNSSGNPLNTRQLGSQIIGRLLDSP
jgi:hypothetical protein